MSTSTQSDNHTDRQRKPETTVHRLRQIRNDKGNAALIGVLIALALTGLMLSLAGPDMLDILRGARGQKLEANFQQAVSVVEARIQQEPEWLNVGNASDGAGAAMDGTPHTEFLDVLISDGSDFTWVGASDAWALAPNDDDTTIRVQFLQDGTAAAVGTNVAGPTVSWLVRSGAAIRLQSRNSDGAWVCALIVARPSVTSTQATAQNNYLRDGDSNEVLAAAPTYSERRIAAFLGGTWYDQGDSYANPAASHSHCDPVGQDPTNTAADLTHEWLPNSGSQWKIGTTAATATTEVGAHKTFTRNLN